jgi:glycosyltransferase involved in cell wall biosynthesis
VSGLLTEQKGISQAARLTVAALRASGFRVLPHDIRPVFEHALKGSAEFPASDGGGVWILHMNPPEALLALAAIPAKEWLGRYRIGYWAYELPRIPPEWVRIAHAFHEIWVPSAYVESALLTSGVRIPVRVMPHPVAVLTGSAIVSPTSGADEYFSVLVLGDLRSSAERKNLLGAVEIYKRAFPTEESAARLHVKVLSDDFLPVFLRTLREAVGRRQDIQLITDRLDNEQMLQLIARHNVLMSPHRAEGFGLSLAEAFLLGRPALATGWSGNLEFMGQTPELLINYHLTPVFDRSGIYRDRTQLWAEPDIDDAATKLRTLRESRHLREEVAKKGRSAVQAHLRYWSEASLKTTALGRLTRFHISGP